MNKQKKYDLYYLKMADVAASQSPCVKRRVGCVLVKNNIVKGTSFNWRPAKTDCDNWLCKRLDVPTGKSQADNICCNHSEMNLITFTSYEDRVGATLYCTHAPCPLCAQLILGAQIKRLVFYKDDRMDGIKLIKELTHKSKRLKIKSYPRLENISP